MDPETTKGPVFWENWNITKEDRCKIKGHRSAIIWFTGLPSSGKTTVARELDRTLHERGVHTYILDGDNVRHGLNKNLGFSREERRENIRRIAEVSKLFMDAGIITLCAFVSPYAEDRLEARGLVADGEFIEIFLKCSVDVCMQRDPKQLYKKAMQGELKGFTGVDDPYEAPQRPEIVLETDKLAVSECVAKILNYLLEKEFIRRQVPEASASRLRASREVPESDQPLSS